MVRSVEEEIKEEIKKATDWYRRTYKKEVEVHHRYDKVDKHFSWRIVASIGGQDRVMGLGISAVKAEGKDFPQIKARIFDYVKQTLIKAQVKYEPHILALK